jgi:single-strand DNA-binding protein
MSLNQVTILGNVGMSPKLLVTKTGTAILEFSLATHEKRGEVQETHWHRVKAFGKTAEISGGMIQKGDEVFVSGRLWNRAWTDKDGKQRSSVEIVASYIRVSKKRDYQSETGEMRRPETMAQPEPFTEDNIPF